MTLKNSKLQSHHGHSAAQTTHEVAYRGRCRAPRATSDRKSDKHHTAFAIGIASQQGARRRTARALRAHPTYRPHTARGIQVSTSLTHPRTYTHRPSSINDSISTHSSSSACHRAWPSITHTRTFQLHCLSNHERNATQMETSALGTPKIQSCLVGLWLPTATLAP